MKDQNVLQVGFAFFVDPFNVCHDCKACVFYFEVSVFAITRFLKFLAKEIVDIRALSGGVESGFPSVCE